MTTTTMRLSVPFVKGGVQTQSYNSLNILAVHVIDTIAHVVFKLICQLLSHFVTFFFLFKSNFRLVNYCS